MTELLTAAQMRAIEQAAIESGEVTGLELMERAGQGVVEAILEEWPELATTSAPRRRPLRPRQQRRRRVRRRAAPEGAGLGGGGVSLWGRREAAAGCEDELCEMDRTVVDRLTEAVDPLKMYEYLAAGRGVVSTPLPACVGVDAVEVADGAAAFVAAIERVMASDRMAIAARARAAATAASWDVRIQPLLTRLDGERLRRMPG